VLTTNWDEAGKKKVEPADPSKMKEKALEKNQQGGRNVNFGGRDINVVGMEGVDLEKH
jgi:uncharacterized Fe-S radical SAM superfamily protein PflX